MPTTLKLIYGPQSAGKIYGVLFSFTGIANLIIMILTKSELGKNYEAVLQISGYMSLLALLLLLFAFKEEKIYLKRHTNLPLKEEIKA